MPDHARARFVALAVPGGAGSTTRLSVVCGDETGECDLCPSFATDLIGEQEADAALAAHGWVRTGPWWLVHNGAAAFVLPRRGRKAHPPQGIGEADRLVDPEAR